MGIKLGMDTGAAREKQSALQSQVNGLSSIATDLLSTHSAAMYPESYGITTGETTVAPWSIGSLTNARAQINSAQSAANGLLQLILSEADSQDRISSNPGFIAVDNADNFFNALDDSQPFDDIYGWAGDIGTLLTLPGAINMLAKQPGMWGTGLNPANWGASQALRIGGQFDDFMLAGQTPGWMRGAYSAAGRLEFQNYLNPTAFSDARHAARWTDMMSPATLSGVQKGAAVLGKGLAIVGAVGGAVQFGTGAIGALDGDISSEDAWNMADGAVTTITSIGSLAPPPVGVVFAGVGLAYGAGRWLFGEDDGGKTGIDHISDGLNATGKFLGEVGDNVAAGQAALVRGATAAATQVAGDVMNNAKDLADTAGAVVNVAGNMANDAIGNAAKVADDLWPW